MIGRAAAWLPADLADATWLTAAYLTTLRPLRPRGTGRDPGLAVMLADGGVAIADLALLRDEGKVFGPVASTPTSWRLLAAVAPAAPAALGSKGHGPGGRLLQAAETRSGIPAARAGGRDLPQPCPGHRRHPDQLPLPEEAGRAH